MALRAQYGDGVSEMNDKRVYIYDSTLRDGAQTQGVDFTAADKAAVARELDRIGIDYIEGGTQSHKRINLEKHWLGKKLGQNSSNIAISVNGLNKAFILSRIPFIKTSTNFIECLADSTNSQFSLNV